MATQLKSDDSLVAGQTFEAQVLGVEGPQRAMRDKDLTGWSSSQTYSYALIVQVRPGVAQCMAFDGTLDDVERTLRLVFGITPDAQVKTTPWTIGYLDGPYEDVRIRRANTTKLRHLVAQTLAEFLRQDPENREIVSYEAAIRVRASA